mmetsp:Transcript_8089/g.18491  ORF Transcript_8089/g.18491 Transcript_8089/m.18491 type:complete len:87 (-) Transcript_8089:75-335(-)
MISSQSSSYSTKSSSSFEEPTRQTLTQNQAWRELGKRHKLRVCGFSPDELEIAQNIGSSGGCFAWVTGRHAQGINGVDRRANNRTR